MAGSDSFITEAWRFKQRWGGALRQSGIAAAMCIYALDHNIERLADDRADCHPRVQRGIGILEDHLKATAQLMQSRPRHLGQVLALKEHLPRARSMELQHSAPQGRLATQRLAHDPQHLTSLKAEGHVVDSGDQPFVGAELQRQVFDFDQGTHLWLSE